MVLRPHDIALKRRTDSRRARKRGHIALFVLLSVAACTLQTGQCGISDVKQLMQKMEEDVLDLVKEVERAYKLRCFNNTLSRCVNANYDECFAEYPSQSCRPGGEQFRIPKCGDGITCGGLFDFNVTSLWMPFSVRDGRDGNPTDRQVIESVCYTRQMESWMVQKHQDDQHFWDGYGVDSPLFYFGAHDGTFRIFPAHQLQTCGNYDPRKRPWYIAASSGPKNIVLVLDTSNSMITPTDQRLRLMKEAASLVVNTLTVGDRVAIVEFNTNATLFADPDDLMFVATQQNKEALTNVISNFEADGKTNFYDAFDKAFDVLDATIDDESHSPCNSAILFLTDGVMTKPDGINEVDVIELVMQRKALIEQKSRHDLYLFTYSVGDSSVHKFPKDVACATGQGVWSEIDDNDELVSSLGSYYKLFALGLGDGRNEDFVAWVEPYEFIPSGELGTTVSAPVYDRSVNPPLFIGVAAFDFTIAVMLKAGGGDVAVTEILEEIVSRTAKCPVLSLSPCELESYRRQGVAGVNAICDTKNCTSDAFVGVYPEQCSVDSSLYPKNLWNNVRNRWKTYIQAVCCIVGDDKPSEQCPGVTEKFAAASDNGDDDTFGKGAIIGTVVGATIAISAVACTWYKFRPRPKPVEHIPPTPITLDTPPVPLESSIPSSSSRE